MSDDERAVRALMERWMTASSSGDVGTVLTLMADDTLPARARGRWLLARDANLMTGA